MTEEEEKKIRREFEKCLTKHRYFGDIFASLSEQEKNRILKYLSYLSSVKSYTRK